MLRAGEWRQGWDGVVTAGEQRQTSFFLSSQTEELIRGTLLTKAHSDPNPFHIDSTGAKPSSEQPSAPNPYRAAWVEASEALGEEGGQVGAGGRAQDPARALMSCRHLSAGRGNQPEEAPGLLLSSHRAFFSYPVTSLSSPLVVVVVCQQMGDLVFVLNEPGVSLCGSQGCFW